MADGEWVKVAAIDDIAEESVIGVSVGNRRVAIYRLAGGEFHATDNICTHEHAELSDGFLEGCEIECPLHGGKFDIRTGKGLCEPIEQDIQVFACRVEAGSVWVKVQK